MARGTTLGEMVTQLRNEVGDSTNAGVSLEKNASYRHILARQQEVLYDEHDWPHMRCYRDVTTYAGQRYYDFPADLEVDNVSKVETYFSGYWYETKYGIDSTHYNIFKSDTVQATTYFDITAGTAGGGNTISSVKVAGIEILVTAVAWATSNQATATAVAAQINATVTYPQYTATASGNRVSLAAPTADGATANGRALLVTANGTVTVSAQSGFINGVSCQRSDPVERWLIYENSNVAQVELWPVPAAQSTLRLWGTRKLRPLIADSDVADLDDRLIVLSAAAELTAGKPVSQEKLRKAAARMVALKGQLSKRQPFGLGTQYREGPGQRTVVVKVAGT